ncbi:MAG: type II toxin-antitoxin system HicA family toxin [Sulfuriferula sp.]
MGRGLCGLTHAAQCPSVIAPYALIKLGFTEVRQCGSYKQFRDSAGYCTTVPFHQGRDISPILLRQIAKDIGLALDEFLKHR